MFVVCLQHVWLRRVDSRKSETWEFGADWPLGSEVQRHPPPPGSDPANKRNNYVAGRIGGAGTRGTGGGKSKGGRIVRVRWPGDIPLEKSEVRMRESVLVDKTW